MTVGFYYTLATLNFIENLAFSIHKNEDIVSFRNMTGAVHEKEHNVFKKSCFRNSVEQCPKHLDV